MTKFFHATFARRVSSIERCGLMPGLHRTWRNALDEELGSQDHVYLSSDFMHTVLWAGKMQFDFEEPAAIVVVEADEADMRPDDHWQSSSFGGGWVVHEGRIEPDHLVGVIDVDPDLLRAAVRRQEMDWTDWMKAPALAPASMRKAVRAEP